MADYQIDDLEFDEYNETEMQRHGVSVREVRQVLGNDYEVLRNAKAHAATYIMVGKTDGGRWLSVPIGPTGIPGVWRPATAFPSPKAHLTKLKGR